VVPSPVAHFMITSIDGAEEKFDVLYLDEVGKR